MATILFIHGLNSNDSPALEAKKFFKKHNYSFKEFRLFRHNFQFNIKISTVVGKINSKLHELQEGGDREIYVIGHSLGSVSALISKEINSVTKLVLWESSMNPYDVLINTSRHYNIEIDKEIMDDSKQYNDLSKYIKNINVPTLMIGAKKGGYKLTEKYYDLLSRTSCKKEIIDDADHNFLDKKSKDLLFTKTYSFIR